MGSWRAARCARRRRVRPGRAMRGAQRESSSYERVGVISARSRRGVSIGLEYSYFIYRYFSGRNPTSTIWPILISIFFFMVTQIVSLFNNYFSWVQILILFVTIVVFLLLREAHNRRKNEIFNKSL